MSLLWMPRLTNVKVASWASGDEAAQEIIHDEGLEAEGQVTRVAQ